jgi:type IV pilus assembly protein PilV
MNTLNTRTLNRGFTLVEAMVGLVVLSVGLLGVAALQLSSLRANSSASYRSQATFLAYDIADRMRANRDEALAELYDIDFGEETAEEPETIAESDLQEWLARVSGSLPTGAVAQIEHMGASTFAIRLRWDDARGDFASTDENTEMMFEMRVGI